MKSHEINFERKKQKIFKREIVMVRKIKRKKNRKLRKLSLLIKIQRRKTQNRE